MWRYRVLNLGFVVLGITLFTMPHAAGVFGPPAARRGSGADWAPPERFPLLLGGAFSRRLQAPTSLARAAAVLAVAWRHGLLFEEWWLEYNTCQWELRHASSRAESDLLQARFHVANAEVFTAAMGENGRAGEELARAEKWLAAAPAIANADFDRQSRTVRAELTAVEIPAQEHVEEDRLAVRFERIKADLDRLIEIVRGANLGTG